MSLTNKERQLLNRAIQIAVEAHAGQMDRAGQPYILHPLRVMLKMNSDEEMMAAVLHDVVEDSTITLSDLKNEGFPLSVIRAVELLTRHESDDYFDHVRRIGPNKLALKIKLADLEDNMNTQRLPQLMDKDLQRMEKYRKAKSLLSKDQS